MMPHANAGALLTVLECSAETRRVLLPSQRSSAPKTLLFCLVRASMQSLGRRSRGLWPCNSTSKLRGVSQPQAPSNPRDVPWFSRSRSHGLFQHATSSETETTKYSGGIDRTKLAAAAGRLLDDPTAVRNR